MEVQLQASYEIQTQKLGLDKCCVAEGTVLNRIVRCDESGCSLEADPRHAELVIEQSGVGDLRLAATPGSYGIEEVDSQRDEIPRSRCAL